MPQIKNANVLLECKPPSRGTDQGLDGITYLGRSHGQQCRSRPETVLLRRSKPSGGDVPTFYEASLNQQLVL